MNKISKCAAVVLVIFLAGCAAPAIVYEITSEILDEKRIDRETRRAISETQNDIAQLNDKTSGTVKVLAKHTEAVYPELLLEQNLSGYVTLRYSVSREGKVENIEIVERKGDVAFETAAISAVKTWEYAPMKIPYHVVFAKLDFVPQRSKFSI
ncbi:energy transducer TonB [Shewanella sp. HL-SH2]|uniref:energy transducer TonB n=1 Tax=Shewanella sp. HL-SH2 TaxID=3436238 RepID=UPI003EB78467